MRSIQATHDQFAVSANVRESAINTIQTLDTTMLFDIGDLAKLEARREDNSSQAIGKEEPDLIYDNGALATLDLNASMAMPQHFGFLLGYGLGSVASSAQGDGHKHIITPISDDLDSDRSNPSFSLAQRYGKTVLKRLFYSMFIDAVTIDLKKDSWAKIGAKVKGTGKNTADVESETVAALDNATTLTLAANGVAGSSAADRLANIHQIKVELASGVWTEVAFSAVSNATPAAITITSAGGAGTDTVNYKILYRPAEAAWGTFPARVTEDALRVAQLSVIHGGKWNGTAFTGGRTVTSELNAVQYNLNNNGKCEMVPGGGGAYAGRYKRDGRTQKVKLDREFREYIFQQHITDNDTFGLYAKLEGDLYDATYKYQVEMILPKLGVLAADLGLDGKRLAEGVDLQVLEDDTYGSVIFVIQNLVEKYAAAS
ncbi:MAG: hypothetical protein LLG40_11165 [Deltaproteobacteria bacterium]|nr:hypothetical protein [Deltaproteobacteria bacterium]